METLNEPNVAELPSRIHLVLNKREYTADNSFLINIARQAEFGVEFEIIPERERHKPVPELLF